jgi:hypothetical protein
MKKLIFIFAMFLTLASYAQPANDFCTGVQSTIPDGTCYNGTLVAANDNWTGEVGCATGGGANNHIDVWYSFVATGTQFDITVTDISIGANLEVVLTSAAALPCTGPFTVYSTFCGASPLTGTYGGLTIGNTYYYTISSEGGNGNGATNPGTFTTCVDNSTPGATGNQDCVNATALCSNSAFAGNSSGAGTQELNATNQGCLFTEHQSSWYTFTIQTSGTLTMDIIPQNGTDDYDFAIWGPNSACPPTTTPAGCSFSASPVTGFNGTGTNPSDGTGGDPLDGYSSTLNVVAGETYVLLIDNFSASGGAFDLNWGGTASLDCAVLSVEFIDMVVNCNSINWTTSSETNNDHFNVYYSLNAYDWKLSYTTVGNGTIHTPAMYEIRPEENLKSGYYMLTQTDFNGKIDTLGTKYLNCVEYNSTILEGVWTIDGRYLGNIYPTKSGTYVLKYKGFNKEIRGIINNK